MREGRRGPKGRVWHRLHHRLHARGEWAHAESLVEQVDDPCGRAAFIGEEPPVYRGGQIDPAILEADEAAVAIPANSHHEFAHWQVVEGRCPMA